jgi:mono/diheme cytochrome c family protein
MNNSPLKWILAFSVFAIANTWGLPWDKDMVDQPSIKAQESTVNTPATSIPLPSTPLGRETSLPIPQSIGELVSARFAAAVLVNPIQVSSDSLAQGEFFYQTYCLLCHGQEGRGDGPVGKKFIPPPMNLTLAYVQSQPDGQLFYTITHGSIVMPYYRDAMNEKERWHLVNYLKELGQP